MPKRSITADTSPAETRKKTKKVEKSPPAAQEAAAPPKKKKAPKGAKEEPAAAAVPKPAAAKKELDLSSIKAAASSKLDVPQVGRALVALLTHVERERGLGAGLLDDGAPVHVLLSLKHMPKAIGKAKMDKPVALSLPHPYVDPDTAAICLITKDPQREYKDKLAEAGVNITKVIGVSKLKAKYHPHQAKRELCGAHEVFLADARVLPMLPPLLGKTFFKKRRLPLACDLTKKDLKAEIMRAACGAHYRHSSGNSNSVQLGVTSQPAKQIAANIVAGVEQMVDLLPGKWANVQSLMLRTTNSVALPFFNALPNA